MLCHIRGHHDGLLNILFLALKYSPSSHANFPEAVFTSSSVGADTPGGGRAVGAESSPTDAAVEFRRLPTNSFLALSCADQSSLRGSPPFGLQDNGFLLVSQAGCT